MRTARTLAINLLAVGSLVGTAASLPTAGVTTLILGTLAIILWARASSLRRSAHLNMLGTFGGARLLLLATATIGAAAATKGWQRWAVAGAGAAAITLLLLASVVRRRLARGDGAVRGVPTISDSRPFTEHSGVLTVANMLVTAALAVTAIMPRLALLSAILSVVLFAATLGALAIAQSQAQIRNTRVKTGVEQLAPRFAIYLTGPGGTAYQLQGWVEYFERIGEPWVVLLREARHFNAVRTMTNAPIVTVTTLRQLDEVIAPSLTTVFYVNNGAKNSHCIRYGHLTHVQLLHGDSDKPSSYSPVTQMFDQVFVAGQAGMDRYHNHGVDIPERRFEIVGRPQVAGIERATGALPDVLTVLYAPTWGGFQEGSNYGSLPISGRIVRVLLARGARVVFRPHPYSLRDPISRQQIAAVEELIAADDPQRHVFGAPARDIDIVECFNMSDALVSDVSAVPADFLFSDKPFAVTKMDDLPMDEFITEFPLARASYLLDGAASETSLAPIIEDMLGTDPLAEMRERMRTYYLGDFPSEGYEEVFLRAARRVIAKPKSAARAALSGPARDDLAESETTATPAD